VLRTPDRLRRNQFQTEWSGGNSLEGSPAKMERARKQLKVENKVDGSVSPYELPKSEEFGLKLNQMNEFIRFGESASGASARVVKCLRIDGDVIGVYALKVIV
jgi:hypothetical protein